MSEADHEELLRIVTGYRRAGVVLSGYRSRLYDQALRKWTRYEFATTVAASGGHDPERKARRVEVVWVRP